jgi:2'-5' RNA ligase
MMETTAMIAYLPENGAWCKQDLPHMTLVYAGPTDQMQATDLNAMAKDAITAARITGPFSLPVISVEQYGDEGEEVDVLVMYSTPQLIVARKLVEHWNKSEKPFTPHATVGPAGSAFVNTVGYVDDGSSGSEYRDFDRNVRRETLPDRLYFNRIAVCWNDKKLVFNTNSF